MSDCIFCKIINKEIPSEILYEDDLILAFNDIEAQAPVHFLVIPKKHIQSLNRVEEKDLEIIAHIIDTIPKIAEEKGIDKNGYRVVNNCGKNGGQTVDHLHFHVLGGRNLTWPPG